MVPGNRLLGSDPDPLQGNNTKHLSPGREHDPLPVRPSLDTPDKINSIEKGARHPPGSSPLTQACVRKSGRRPSLLKTLGLSVQDRGHHRWHTHPSASNAATSSPTDTAAAAQASATKNSVTTTTPLAAPSRAPAVLTSPRTPSTSTYPTPTTAAASSAPSETFFAASPRTRSTLNAPVSCSMASRSPPSTCPAPLTPAATPCRSKRSSTTPPSVCSPHPLKLAPNTATGRASPSNSSQNSAAVAKRKPGLPRLSRFHRMTPIRRPLTSTPTPRLPAPHSGLRLPRSSREPPAALTYRP